MVDTLVTLTASATLTDKDGDTVTDSEAANIGANLQFADDGPSAAIVNHRPDRQPRRVRRQPGRLEDVTGPIAAFAGVTNAGDDLDVAGTGPIQYATNASAIVASTGSSFGADARDRRCSASTSLRRASTPASTRPMVTTSFSTRKAI